MNIKSRDFSILGYIMAITKKAEDNTPDAKLKHRAFTLRQACRKTTSEYPGGLINVKEMKQINKKVQFLIDKTFCVGIMSTKKEITKTVTALSMILCFLNEIDKKSKNEWYKSSFNNITKKVVWLLEYIDPKYSHYLMHKNGERLYDEMNKTF